MEKTLSHFHTHTNTVFNFLSVGQGWNSQLLSVTSLQRNDLLLLVNRQPASVWGDEWSSRVGRDRQDVTSAHLWRGSVAALAPSWRRSISCTALHNQSAVMSVMEEKQSHAAQLELPKVEIEKPNMSNGRPLVRPRLLFALASIN